MNHAIAAGSQQLAEARHNFELATADLAKIEGHRQAVQGNIQKLLEKRAAIAARRATGQSDDLADGAALQVISLDLAGLDELLAKAQSDVTSAQSHVQQAAQQVHLAEQTAARAEDQALVDALVPHIDHLATLLYDAMIEAKAINARLGTRETWKPTNALQHELRRREHGVVVRAA